MRRIWGIQFEEYYADRYVWIAEIGKKFYYNGKFVIGLNEKFLNEARRKDVILRVKIDNEEKVIQVPTEKQLKEKVKSGDFEDKKSLFDGGKDMRIYYFDI